MQMNKDNELNINMYVGLGHSKHRHRTWTAVDQEVEGIDLLVRSLACPSAAEQDT